MTISRVRGLLAASPPLLTAVLVAKLWATGTLGYYVNSRTVWIVLLGAILFAGVGVVVMRAAILEGNKADGGRRRRFTWRTAAFFIPLVAGLVLPAQPLSAISGQASSLGGLQLASHVSSGNSGDRFGYWVSALANHPDVGWWTGQHVTMVGFAALQSGMPKDTFIVGRYLVTCCVVDATLFGFPVRVSRGKLPPEGAWVQVKGEFGRTYWTDPTGAQYPFIEQAQISFVNTPASPYLSP